MLHCENVCDGCWGCLPSPLGCLPSLLGLSAVGVVCCWGCPPFGSSAAGAVCRWGGRPPLGASALGPPLGPSAIGVVRCWRMPNSGMSPFGPSACVLALSCVCSASCFCSGSIAWLHCHLGVPILEQLGLSGCCSTCRSGCRRSGHRVFPFRSAAVWAIQTTNKVSLHTTATEQQCLGCLVEQHRYSDKCLWQLHQPPRVD